MHKLIKIWIFLVVFAVVLHVSAPYNNTDFTFVLKNLILVLAARQEEDNIHQYFNIHNNPLSHGPHDPCKMPWSLGLG